MILEFEYENGTKTLKDIIMALLEDAKYRALNKEDTNYD